MTTRVDQLSGFAVLTEAPHLMQAHLIAGRLRDEGIRTFVDDDHLADEWAMSQKLLGGLRVRVLVPADRLDEARVIFLAMSQPIPALSGDEELADYADERRVRMRRVGWLGFFLILGLPLLAWGFFLLAGWLGWHP